MKKETLHTIADPLILTWIDGPPCYKVNKPNIDGGELVSKSIAEELAGSLKIMTALCRLKYGNLEKDVYGEILKAEAVLQKATAVNLIIS